MGILDDLKQQANRQRHGEAEDRARRAELDEYYEKQILPAMEALYGYLFELTEQLNYLKTDISYSYTVENLGMLENLQQTDYRVSVDSRRNMKKLILSFSCKGEGREHATIEGNKAIDTYSEYLRTSRLTFDHVKIHSNTPAGQIAEFSVDNEVPVIFAFMANIEKARIDLLVTNFDRIASYRLQLKPEQIDAELLDRLGRYILRERSDFLELDITDEAREQIRKQVRESQLHRERELLAAEARERAEGKAVKPASHKGLLGSIKRKLKP